MKTPEFLTLAFAAAILELQRAQTLAGKAAQHRTAVLRHIGELAPETAKQVIADAQVYAAEMSQTYYD